MKDLKNHFDLLGSFHRFLPSFPGTHLVLMASHRILWKISVFKLNSVIRNDDEPEEW